MLHLESIKTLREKTLEMLISLLQIALGAVGVMSLIQGGTSLPTLTIGAYFPLTGPCWTGGNATKTATQLALDQVNKRNDILGKYHLQMVWNDTKCDPGVGLHILYDHIYNNPQKIMLLGPAFSGVTQPIAEIANTWNLIQISYGATSPAFSNRQIYPRFFRTISSDSAFNPARVALMKRFGWKRVGTLYHEHPSGIFSEAIRKLHNLLRAENITTISSESFTTNPANQISNLKKKDARIIVGSFYEKEARKVFCEAYKQGMYGSNYVWMIIGWYDAGWWKRHLAEDGVKCSRNEMRKVTEGYIGTDNMKLNEDDNTTNITTISGLLYLNVFALAKDHILKKRRDASKHTAMQYATIFEKLTSQDARIESSFAYDAVWAIAAALDNVSTLLNQQGSKKQLENFTYEDSEMADLLESALYNLSFLGVTGPVSFTRNGERIGLIQIEQNQGGKIKTVGVYVSNKDSLVLSSKSPIQWQGSRPPKDHTIHVVELKTISKGLFAFLATVTALGIILASVFLAINVKFRDERLIKMSSPRLNNLIIIGCIMAYISVFLFGVDGIGVTSKTHGVICGVRVWVLSLGFTVAFGAMFSKTWRVHTIFKNITPQRRVIRDEQLFAIVGGLVVIDVILLSLWSGIDPMTQQMEVFYNEVRMVDDKVVTPKMAHCQSGSMIYWLGALYAFKGLLMLFGMFLAWETRHVTIPALNDSKYIGISVYNVVVLSILGVVITTLTHSNQDATFAITGIFIIFCTTITLCLVFLPKGIKLWKGEVDTETTSRISAKPGSESNTTMDKNAVSLTMENSSLKRLLAEREEQLMEIKRLLAEDQSPVQQDESGQKLKRIYQPSKKKASTGSSRENLRARNSKGAHANSGYDVDEKSSVELEHGAAYIKSSTTSV